MSQLVRAGSTRSAVPSKGAGYAAAVEHVALFVHLAGAFCLISGAVVAGAGFETARRGDDIAQIAALLGIARLGVVLVAVGTVVVAGTGAWLVDLGDWGLGTGWIRGAILLLILAVVAGAAGGRRPKRARLVAERLAWPGGPPSRELRALLDDRLSRAANASAGLLLIAIVGLMVFKP